ncbi:MAG: ferritin-like domain-containing protein [Rhizobiales bacterium]|nr:ferritin-like domain-containing protein [Rhizobacter sp.]
MEINDSSLRDAATVPTASRRARSARADALAVLCLADPIEKAARARTLFAELDDATIDPAIYLNAPGTLPGRPALPRLVPATEVPARSPFTPAGRAALLHAVTHIEFNAINLALDAAWRFPGMPIGYYRDWLRVASEEALHFGLLRDHLVSLGADYGAFDAHDGLWAMTERTAHDITARMALVPRTLEARGLDATPPMQAKLRRAGDLRAVEILEVILRDEVGHVAIGNHWYRWLCARDGHDPVTLYAELTVRYQAPRLRPPFNDAARRAAGFTQAEIDLLT